MTLRNYTRWRAGGEGLLYADLLGAHHAVTADTSTGRVLLDGAGMSPDEARLIGVRLIEAAALADGDRAIRRPPTDQEGGQS